jgi:hypothetical protein
MYIIGKLIKDAGIWLIRDEIIPQCSTANNLYFSVSGIRP